MICSKCLASAVLLVLAGCQTAMDQGEAGSRPFELAGTTWILIEYGTATGGQTLAEVAPYAYTMSLEKGGTAQFKLDCNRGTGRWQATSRESEGDLTFDPIATTKAMCQPESIGGQISADLPRVIRYSIYDGRLTLQLGQSDRIYVWDIVD